MHRHDGLHMQLRKSKADQEGREAVKALPFTDSHETFPPCAYVRCSVYTDLRRVRHRWPPLDHPAATEAGTVHRPRLPWEFPGPPPAHRC